MRGLLWFGRWFASAAGTWQTMFIVSVVTVAELAGVITDAHGFWLLYWLTIYSAVTQPVLAFIGRQSGEHQEKILAHCEQILSHLRSDDELSVEARPATHDRLHAR